MLFWFRWWGRGEECHEILFSLFWFFPLGRVSYRGTVHTTEKSGKWRLVNAIKKAKYLNSRPSVLDIKCRMTVEEASKHPALDPVIGPFNSTSSSLPLCDLVVNSYRLSVLSSGDLSLRNGRSFWENLRHWSWRPLRMKEYSHKSRLTSFLIKVFWLSKTFWVSPNWTKRMRDCRALSPSTESTRNILMSPGMRLNVWAQRMVAGAFWISFIRNGKCK